MLLSGCTVPCVLLPCVRGQSSNCSCVRARGQLCRNAVETGATVAKRKGRMRSCSGSLVDMHAVRGDVRGMHDNRGSQSEYGTRGNAVYLVIYSV